MKFKSPISGLKIVDSSVKMPLMLLPARMVHLELETGKILWSPLPKTTEEDFRQLGEVTDIVAPNLFHHLGLRRARLAFPKARVWGVPGFATKRSDIPFSHWFGQSTWPHESELPMLLLRGLPRVNEVVFFHRSSQTLLVTDLCMNLTNVSGLGARVMLGLFGTDGKLATSRLLKVLLTDRQALAESLAQLLEWDFKNIVMAHGDIVLGEGRTRLKTALRERRLLKEQL